MPVLDELLNLLRVFWAISANTWWLWLPVVLFLAGRELWRFYLKVRYWTNLRWLVLEVRIPREIPKTPEAMEQIFAGLQTFYWGFDFLETWWEGLQHDYLIFEMVSLGGETHFFIRLPVFFRNVIEAQIYAQYPEAEVSEVSDYIQLLPSAVPSPEWDLFGVEFSLEKEDAYPIRTYRDFMSLAPGQKEPEKVDPFSAIAELFGRLKPGEYMAYHLLIRPTQTPTPEAWREAGEKLVSKLIGRKEEAKKGKIAKALEPLEPITKGWGEPLRPLFGLGPATPAVPKREEKAEASLMQHLSPGTKDIVAAIERNILKPGFETVVRFGYVARREMFTLAHLSSFIGALKQYNTLTLNGFKLNGKAMATKAPWWWPKFLKKRRQAFKKALFYRYFRGRKPFTDLGAWFNLRSKAIVLNTEELATIFHFPGTTTRAPLMPRLEARRGEPPAVLPVG